MLSLVVGMSSAFGGFTTTALVRTNPDSTLFPVILTECIFEPVMEILQEQLYARQPHDTRHDNTWHTSQYIWWLCDQKKGQQRRENTLSKVQINRLFARAIYIHKKKNKRTNKQTSVCNTCVNKMNNPKIQQHKKLCHWFADYMIKKTFDDCVIKKRDNSAGKIRYQKYKLIGCLHTQSTYMNQRQNRACQSKNETVAS